MRDHAQPFDVGRRERATQRRASRHGQAVQLRYRMVAHNERGLLMRAFVNELVRPCEMLTRLDQRLRAANSGNG